MVNVSDQNLSVVRVVSPCQSDEHVTRCVDLKGARLPRGPLAGRGVASVGEIGKELAPVHGRNGNLKGVDLVSDVGHLVLYLKRILHACLDGDDLGNVDSAVA